MAWSAEEAAEAGKSSRGMRNSFAYDNMVNSDGSPERSVLLNATQAPAPEPSARPPTRYTIPAWSDREEAREAEQKPGRSQCQMACLPPIRKIFRPATPHTFSIANAHAGNAPRMPRAIAEDGAVTDAHSQPASSVSPPRVAPVHI